MIGDLVIWNRAVVGKKLIFFILLYFLFFLCDKAINAYLWLNGVRYIVMDFQIIKEKEGKKEGRKEGSDLFNDSLSIFYLRLDG